jgi:hypothetical protein
MLAFLGLMRVPHGLCPGEAHARDRQSPHPSRLGGISTGGEGGVEEADGEVLLPIVVGEEDELALVCAIVEEEL